MVWLESVLKLPDRCRRSINAEARLVTLVVRNWT